MSRFTFKQVAAVALGCAASGCAHPAGVEGLRMVNNRGRMQSGQESIFTVGEAAAETEEEAKAALESARKRDLGVLRHFGVNPKFAAALEGQQLAGNQFDKEWEMYQTFRNGKLFRDPDYRLVRQELEKPVRTASKALDRTRCEALAGELQVYSALKHSPAFMKGFKGNEKQEQDDIFEFISEYKQKLKEQMRLMKCSRVQRVRSGLARKYYKMRNIMMQMDKMPSMEEAIRSAP